MKISSVLTTLIFPLAAAAQSDPSPTQRAAQMARWISIAVDTCPLVSNNGLLKLQLGRASAAEVVQEERACIDRFRAALEKRRSSDFAVIQSEAPKPCADQTLDLLALTLAHLDGFISANDTTRRSMQDRINREIGEIKRVATKARLVCD